MPFNETAVIHFKGASIDEDLVLILSTVESSRKQTMFPY